MPPPRAFQGSCSEKRSSQLGIGVPPCWRTSYGAKKCKSEWPQRTVPQRKIQGPVCCRPPDPKDVEFDQLQVEAETSANYLDAGTWKISERVSSERDASAS